MLKKTIKINPELFNLSSANKTQKNRERKNRHINKSPLINPNSIKKQLLNRIKEHKNNENKMKSPQLNLKIKSSSNENISDFTDEFMDSINYLSSLSKEKKELDSKDNYDRVLKEKRENFLKKTLKNPIIYNPNNNEDENAVGGSFKNHISDIHLELPEELKQNPLIPIQNLAPVIESQEIKINIPKFEDVPYGCLKGGTKPTYRTWQSTRKNHDSTTNHTQISLPIPSVKTSFETYNLDQKTKYELTDREKKLKLLQERVNNQKKILQEEKRTESLNVEPVVVSNVITNMNNTNLNVDVKNENTDLQEMINDYNEPKRMIKKTIKRKYTLGKSKIKKQVGILIKNNQTRKKIINAHKDLKKKSLNDVKNYLRDHGLIKIGSNAPNDVLRKIYESSMLTGDITNKNKDILLHNFLSETGQNV